MVVDIAFLVVLDSPAKLLWSHPKSNYNVAGVAEGPPGKPQFCDQVEASVSTPNTPLCREGNLSAPRIRAYICEEEVANVRIF
ncbi:MAG TPA: hypothetical protein VLZ81_17585 [Blastocatellia bacterium]|nr:hypothetical protein [Blastocatellia bacterium]